MIRLLIRLRFYPRQTHIKRVLYIKIVVILRDRCSVAGGKDEL